MPVWATWLFPVVTLGVAIVALVLNLLSNQGKTEDQQFVIYRETMNARVAMLDEEIVQLRERVTVLEAENVECKASVARLTKQNHSLLQRLFQGGGHQEEA